MSVTLLGLSGTGQGLCCTGLLILLCAGLCEAMMAFLWRAPASCTAACMAPTGICLILLYALMDGMARSMAQPWLMYRPLWLMLVVMALLAAWLAGVALRLYRWRRHHLSQTSVKEGLDLLPAGLCFYAEGGLTRLVNRRMNELCRTLTGMPLLNGEEFWHRLEKGELLPECEALACGESPLVRTADGQVWSFTRTILMVDGQNAVQLVASDVTQEHAMNLRLAKENQRLAEMNRRLRRYGGQIQQLAREKEALDAKVRIHDEFGQALLASRRLLAQPSGVSQRTAALQLWRRSIALLDGADTSEKTREGLEGLIEAAQAIGVHITMEGDIPPADAGCMPLLCNAAHECLTNTVRHAGGTSLHIRMALQGGWVRAVLTNDGTPPSGEIREGGGLSALRRRVEAAGGRMQVQSAPFFSLSIDIPAEGGAWI
ncbi:MAG: sensor histidine kinase [Aristaeellaceae bacterium]